MDKPPVPSKKLATVPVLEANQVKSRMQELTEMAKHVVLINHPEQEVDMDFLTKENLKINPAEFPVLTQLIRDVKNEDSTVNDLEELPQNATMNFMESSADNVPLSTSVEQTQQEPENAEEDRSEQDDQKVVSPTQDTKTDENSPSSKRKKVLVSSSPNSPIIRAKKVPRAVLQSELPTGKI